MTTTPKTTAVVTESVSETKPKRGRKAAPKLSQAAMAGIAYVKANYPAFRAEAARRAAMDGYVRSNADAVTWSRRYLKWEGKWK